MSPPARCEIHVSPHAIVLDGPEASQQILVTKVMQDGRHVDCTRLARFQVLRPRGAAVDGRGLVRPLSDGRTEIVGSYENVVLRVACEVMGYKDPSPVSFARQITPILNKARCNSGGCHGKAEGQN